MVKLGSIEVAILVDGKPLPEHKLAVPEPPVGGYMTAKCWIPSEAGKVGGPVGLSRAPR